MRSKLLQHTGHIVTAYGAHCYSIRGTLLQHTGHIVTAKNVWITNPVSLVPVTDSALIHRIHSVECRRPQPAQCGM